MYRGRGVLLNPFHRILEPSVSHIVGVQRCKSTKSAIHSALHQPEYQSESRSSKSWKTRENVDLARKTARDTYLPKKTRHAGYWEQEGGREANISRENRRWGDQRLSGRWDRSSDYGKLEREGGVREINPRNNFNSGRRGDTNLGDGGSRYSQTGVDLRGRSGTTYIERSRPESQPDENASQEFEDETTLGSAPRNESYARVRGSQREVPSPLTLPYTTSASEFLYGQGVVTAALSAKRREFYKLYMYYQSRGREHKSKDKEMEAMARNAGVPVEKVGSERYRMLDRMSEGRPHNGFVLEASPLPKLPVTGFDRLDRPGQQFLAFLGRQSLEDEKINGADPRIKYNVAGTFPRFPFVLLLDGVLDPQNLGAIMRSAFFFGVDAIALTTNRTAPLSPTALKASAGASEALPILSVDQTRNFLMECKKNGWKVYASGADPARDSKSQNRGLRHLTASNLVSDVNRRPCILIIGSEGQGLYKDVQGAADNTISIEGPRQGELAIDSLNVSVATGLLCQSFLRDPTEGQKSSPSVNGEKYTALDIQERLF